MYLMAFKQRQSTLMAKLQIGTNCSDNVTGWGRIGCGRTGWGRTDIDSGRTGCGRTY